MHPVIDTIMIVLFIIFMIFIFGGYHKNKSAKREADFKEKEQREAKKIKESKD